jgi:hypothetical protein
LLNTAQCSGVRPEASRALRSAPASAISFTPSNRSLSFISLVVAAAAAAAMMMMMTMAMAMVVLVWLVVACRWIH